MLAAFLDMTFRIESPPLLADGPPWSTQASPLALSVCCEPQFGGAAIVQVWRATDGSRLPAASMARTSKLWGPTARPL